MNWKFKLLMSALLITHLITVRGQSLNIPVEGYKNTFGVSVTGGVYLDKEAVMIGANTEYSRMIGKYWILNISFCYDQEHIYSEGDRIQVVNTFAPAVAVGYAFTPRLAAGIGIGKGLFDDDNASGTVKYTKEGNLTLGLLCVYTVFQKGSHSIDIGGGIERGLIESETNLTLELGYGISF